MLRRADLTPEGQAIFDTFRVFHSAVDGRFIVARGHGPYIDLMYVGLASRVTKKAAEKEMARRRYWACHKFGKPKEQRDE